MRDLRIEIDDLTAEQKRADQDVEQVKTRRERDQGMIDAGQVKDPKALERMLGELQSLHRRINSLEDVELEVMERLETAQTALESRTAELAAMEGEETELRGAFQQKAGDLQNELTAAQAERATTAAGLPADLLALYEKLRAQKDGVGCGSAAPPRVRGMPAHPERLRPRHHRQGADRRGAPLRGVQPDPGAHRGVRSVSSPVGDRRGRRRLARQPGPVGVRRGAQGRRHR